jgi:hypothetical protein
MLFMMLCSLATNRGLQVAAVVFAAARAITVRAFGRGAAAIAYVICGPALNAVDHWVLIATRAQERGPFNPCFISTVTRVNPANVAVYALGRFTALALRNTRDWAGVIASGDIGRPNDGDSGSFNGCSHHGYLLH